MKKKRIKLKGWFLVVLKSLLLIDMFFMICEAETLKVMFIKTLITVSFLILIIYILIKFGGLNEK